MRTAKFKGKLEIVHIPDSDTYKRITDILHTKATLAVAPDNIKINGTRVNFIGCDDPHGIGAHTKGAMVEYLSPLVCGNSSFMCLLESTWKASASDVAKKYETLLALKYKQAETLFISKVDKKELKLEAEDLAFEESATLKTSIANVLCINKIQVIAVVGGTEKMWNFLSEMIAISDASLRYSLTHKTSVLEYSKLVGECNTNEQMLAQVLEEDLEEHKVISDFLIWLWCSCDVFPQMAEKLAICGSVKVATHDKGALSSAVESHEAAKYALWESKESFVQQLSFLDHQSLFAATINNQKYNSITIDAIRAPQAFKSRVGKDTGSKNAMAAQEMAAAIYLMLLRMNELIQVYTSTRLTANLAVSAIGRRNMWLTSSIPDCALESVSK